MRTRQITHLYFESGCKILPSTVELVAEHLHRQPLHHVRSLLLELGQHEDSLTGELFKFSPQLSVTASIFLSNLQFYMNYARLAFFMGYGSNKVVQ